MRRTATPRLPRQPAAARTGSLALFLLLLAATPAPARVSDDRMSGDPADDDAMMGDGEEMTMTGASPESTLSQADIDFFESKIRPVLVQHCFGCHSSQATRVRGDLLLDTRAGTLNGGNLGPAVVPGDLDESLLIRAIRYQDEDLEMPPKAKLPDDVIRDFETWITRGAPDPRGMSNGTIDSAGPALTGYAVDVEKGREFWSFKPPLRPETPTVAATSWPLGELDRFTLASMEAKGVEPTEDADRRTWIRRVTFDLVGLPPTPQEVEAFVADRSPTAFERVVDRLLNSDRFGERWGRHWLDVARYAESSGKESNVLYPHAWRYRDYVIDSFNRDKPYDRFLREQLAGDLLPYENATERAENLVATAYLALGPKSHSAQNPRQFTADVIDEQIDAVSQGMLGVTVACARCHDHKFDPIPQRDYYALAGIFLSTTTAFGTERSPGNRHVAPLIELPKEADITLGPSMPPARRSLIVTAAERLEREAEQAAEAARVAKAEGDNVQTFRIRQQRDQSKVLGTILERFDEGGRPTELNRVTMGAVESTRPADAPLLTRGEIDQAGERVPRGFVQVLSDPGGAPSFSSASGRFELAEWIASSKHPLTARVWANRVWLHLFGRGIVPTPDNFGRSGVAPTDQRLLDWLAIRLVELRWSTKSLVREIVLSHTYRLAAEDAKAALRGDPENVTFWRFPSRRLDAEAIRDAMLAAAGTLDTKRPQGSIVNFAEGALRGPGVQQFLQLDVPSTVRSVYLPILRDQVPEALEVFDFAEPAFVTGDRAETSVATQALYLMNAPEVLVASDAFAERVLAEPGDDRDHVELAFRLALGRAPTNLEGAAAREFLRDFPKSAAKATESDGRGRAKQQNERRGQQQGQAQGRRARLRGRLAGGDAEAASQVPEEKLAAWSAFCQTLFQCAEFRTIR
jgi:hypothetical protein